ncbi:sulfatase [Paenibacillus sp. GCM10027626]|uniref:sulfatase family protein n=1 Tax=Paenibacillus sp. GCM10027626 TaxID=3273411 RepID=UPI0036271212
MRKQPNVIYVFSDQHRADAVGYRGNPDLKTPNMDRLARESIDFTTAVAGFPVCCPSRACLMTGQYALTHGVFVNDVSLGGEAVPLAEAFKENGYDTAYIGKWHLDGNGRSNWIPPERRQGFEFWRVLECTHNYLHSDYYGDSPEKLTWDGYDAKAQTDCAIAYIRSHKQQNRPFLMALSWGPPHSPYDTAPQQFKDLYDPAVLTLRPNVPEHCEALAREELAGYYAHISALDSCLGELMRVLDEEGLTGDTIFIYTSDHGDMLGSHGERHKQKPWDESILVPFLLRYPSLFGTEGRKVSAPINTPDIMPTLLGLCGLNIPSTVEGADYSPFLRGEQAPPEDAAILECIHPFGEWYRDIGGKEYRGLRTERYTYVRDLNGPWLLFDNAADPHQMNNLCQEEAYRDLLAELDLRLTERLRRRKDDFLHGTFYIEKHGYNLDETGTVPYTW